MKKDVPPPICYICDKNYENEIYNLFYCICDAAICEECINSVKNSDSTFICPKCSEQNNLKKSKLIRND